MTKLDITNNISRTFHKIGFQLKKHSPEILVVAGVTGTVISAVMACKATTKLSGLLDDTKEKIDMYHQGAEDGKVKSNVNGEIVVVDYTEEDCTRDISIAYAQTALNVAKLYAPAVALGALSITAILASNNIMRKRNFALVTAFATESKLFKEYRGRVIDRFGEELDRELKYNIVNKEVEETVVDEKGKEKKVKKTVQVVDPNSIGQFARFFDEWCNGFDPNDREYNLMFLKAQQSQANTILQKRGYLILNEVYEMLGIPKTSIGQYTGWVYDPKNCDHEGDNFVDFGIYNVENEKARDFVNGREPAILLDFNCDGDIRYIFDTRKIY